MTELYEKAKLGRLTREIVDTLGRRIVSGRHKSLEILPTESELAEQYEASRSVIREGIKILNAKGLVAARPRLGTYVLGSENWNFFDQDVLSWILEGRFSLPLLVDFTNVRLGIEPRAAALAALTGKRKQIRAVRAGLNRMIAANKGEDEILASDIDFHLAILEASNNRFFLRLKPMVSAALAFSIRFTDNCVRDDSVKIKDHLRLCQAIEAGNENAASRASEKLLLSVLELIESSSKRTRGNK